MLVNRNITVGRLRTSVRLEPQFLDALSAIASRERISIDRLCTVIDANTGELGRTAAIRVFIASYFAQLRVREERAQAEQQASTFERTASFQPTYATVSRAG
jgi:predicted DNA-binding ribbon-helix-helix protein|tara:strand:+ start:227 stop:532 length:306 start_codon:yes stop_codon:yes gene_type:complete